MSENKRIEIELDPKSIELLKNVEPMYRDSVINLGIKMIAKTPYYKTLTGEEMDINTMTSLDTMPSGPLKRDMNVTEDKPKSKPKAKKSSWDDF